MKIYLVRHGESQSNYDKKEGKNYFCGQLDVPLTEKGTRSAQLLQSYFNKKDIDHVYLSDLLRTRQTYNAIFDNAIPASVTSSLRERSLGEFEGEMVTKLNKNLNMHVILMMRIIYRFAIALAKKRQVGRVMQTCYNV